MNIRDKEIERLINYAKGLGLIVKFESKDKHGAAASWSIDGTEITVYTNRNRSKISTVLSLIHEISHMLYFIWAKDRVQDEKLDEAITRQIMYDDRETPTPPSKKLREKILQVERNSAKYWDTVYKDTNMQFPYWKLVAQMEYDVWQYEIWAIAGKWPTKVECQKMIKEMKARAQKQNR
jgi:hypothetical protein